MALANANGALNAAVASPAYTWAKNNILHIALHSMKHMMVSRPQNYAFVPIPRLYRIMVTHYFFFEYSDTKLVRIDPGIYSFAFECDLPEVLPTSCEEKYGYIRYLATVHIERPDIPDKTFSTAFTVIKPCNLNADPIHQVCIYSRYLFSFVIRMLFIFYLIKSLFAYSCRYKHLNLLLEIPQ